jgi:hypothetical protein
MTALSLAAAIAGCAPAPKTAEAPPEPIEVRTAPVWVPATGVSLVTVRRTTTAVLIHQDDQDLLRITDERPGDAHSDPSVLTWYVPLPPTPVMDTAIELPASGTTARRAWVIEEPSGGAAHAAPATGTVIVHSRTADVLTATVHLSAGGPAPTAGVVRPEPITYDRTLEFTRFQPRTPQYRELDRRAGIGGGKQ